MSIKFTNKFIEFVKMYIPVKIITIRPNDKPWFNSSIRKAMRIRDRLHKQVKQNSSPFLLRKYKTQRNKVNNMIKYSREQFFINANDMLDSVMEQKKLFNILALSSLFITYSPESNVWGMFTVPH
jgi:hypothetical protein